MKKLFSSVVVFSVAAVFAVSGLFGAGHKLEAQEFSNVGSGQDECFAYYPFSRLVFQTDSDKGLYLPGELLTVRGTINNNHNLPVSDISVLAQLFLNEQGGNPELLIEQKILAEELAVQAGSQLPVSFSYSLPSWLPAGKYHLSLYLLESGMFNVGGLPFIPNVPGNVEAFSIHSAANMAMPYFLLEEGTVNNIPYSRNLPAVPINRLTARFVVPLFNSSAKSETITVAKKFYHWDNYTEDNLIKEETETLTLASKAKQPVNLSVSDLTAGTYMAVFEASLADGSRTQSRFRISLPGERVRIIWSGVSQFPAPANNLVEIATCFANETGNPAVEENENTNRLKTILKDGDREIFSKERGITASPDVGVFTFAFRPKDSLDRKLELTVELYDRSGNLLDSVSKTYDAAKLQPTKKPTGGLIWAIVIALILLGLGVWIYRHSRRPSAFLPVLLFLSFVFWSQNVYAEYRINDTDFTVEHRFPSGDGSARFFIKITPTIDLAPQTVSPGGVFEVGDILQNQSGEWWLPGGAFYSPPFNLPPIPLHNIGVYKMIWTGPIKEVWDNFSGWERFEPSYSPALCYKRADNRICLRKTSNGNDILFWNVVHGDGVTRLRWVGLGNQVTNVNDFDQFKATFSCDFTDKYYQVVGQNEYLISGTNNGGAPNIIVSYGRYFTVNGLSNNDTATIRLKRTFTNCAAKYFYAYPNGEPPSGLQQVYMRPFTSTDSNNVIDHFTIVKDTTITVRTPSLFCQATRAIPSFGPPPLNSTIEAFNVSTNSGGQISDISYAFRCDQGGLDSNFSSSNSYSCNYQDIGTYYPQARVSAIVSGTAVSAQCPPARVNVRIPVFSCGRTLTNPLSRQGTSGDSTVSASNIVGGLSPYKYQFKCRPDDDWSSEQDENSFLCRYSIPPPAPPGTFQTFYPQARVLDSTTPTNRSRDCPVGFFTLSDSLTCTGTRIFPPPNLNSGQVPYYPPYSQSQTEQVTAEAGTTLIAIPHGVTGGDPTRQDVGSFHEWHGYFSRLLAAVCPAGLCANAGGEDILEQCAYLRNSLNTRYDPLRDYTFDNCQPPEPNNLSFWQNFTFPPRVFTYKDPITFYPTVQVSDDPDTLYDCSQSPSFGSFCPAFCGGGNQCGSTNANKPPFVSCPPTEVEITPSTLCRSTLANPSSGPSTLNVNISTEIPALQPHLYGTYRNFAAYYNCNPSPQVVAATTLDNINNGWTRIRIGGLTNFSPGTTVNGSCSYSSGTYLPRIALILNPDSYETWRSETLSICPPATVVVSNLTCAATAANPGSFGPNECSGSNGCQSTISAQGVSGGSGTENYRYAFKSGQGDDYDDFSPNNSRVFTYNSSPGGTYSPRAKVKDVGVTPNTETECPAGSVVVDDPWLDCSASANPPDPTLPQASSTINVEVRNLTGNGFRYRFFCKKNDYNEPMYENEDPSTVQNESSVSHLCTYSSAGSYQAGAQVANLNDTDFTERTTICETDIIVGSEQQTNNSCTTTATPSFLILPQRRSNISASFNNSNFPSPGGNDQSVQYKIYCGGYGAADSEWTTSDNNEPPTHQCSYNLSSLHQGTNIRTRTSYRLVGSEDNEIGCSEKTIRVLSVPFFQHF